MVDETLVVVDRRLKSYDFGPKHPLAPIRVMLAYDNIEAHGLLDAPHVRTAEMFEGFDESLVREVHTDEFIEAVRTAGAANGHAMPGYGLASLDVPIFQGMHEAAVQVCAATFAATEAVASGRVQHALNIAGGLHHAMPARASGFCVYNDIAVSISWLLQQGYERIAYIDVDAHHGDGVEAVFWNDPRVMTISIHESGSTLFPGTGHVSDIGGPAAKGFAVNIPVPAHTTDSQWLRAFDGVVPALLEDFKPQIIFSQHGCDSHRDDPLTHLELTIDGQRAAYRMIHDWAHRYADGKWIAVGGGGYALFDVVPRIWTHLAAIVTHQEDKVSFSDDGDVSFARFDQGWDPNNEIDRSIMAARRSAFPHHGLIADPSASF